MRGAMLAAILIAAIPIGARADSSSFGDWYRKAVTMAHSLIDDGAASDREVIAPPGNVDPDMVIGPKQPQGTMRVIPPPANSGR